MKKHLNTLYITSADTYIRKEQETFVVEKKNEEGEWRKVFQAPVKSIENIVSFGFHPITPQLMAECTEKNVGICFLSENGRFLARVYGAQKGNVLLRKAQYKLADSGEESLKIARNIVAAKAANSRYQLQRHLRNHPEADNTGVSSAIEIIGSRLKNVKTASTLNELRGYEGECANEYFGVLGELITAQRESFSFNGRSRRPPLDPVNALLSFTYAIIANDVRSALEAVGLDPQVGFLHRIRPGRPSLALDIMEEFRAYLGDRIVMNLINLKQVAIQDFEFRESGEVRMSDKARKELLTSYQKRKQEEITHPFLGERITIGLLPHIQAQLLARYIRGDIEEYPPFYLK